MDHLEISAKLTKTDDDITADLMDAIREANDILFPDSEEENNENPRGKPGPSDTDRADSPQEQAMDSDRPDSPIHPYFLAHPEDKFFVQNQFPGQVLEEECSYTFRQDVSTGKLYQDMLMDINHPDVFQNVGNIPNFQKMEYVQTLINSLNASEPEGEGFPCPQGNVNQYTMNDLMESVLSDERTKENEIIEELREFSDI
ncbi:hypothetical protein JTB14_024670 [Gonioctena quinquepunctata]|nr:hypothetical protein JTB14_024670 [Gonioctena quinquepunctata]